MKSLKNIYLICAILFLSLSANKCEQKNSAIKEQEHTEKNQRHLYNVQPPIELDYSLERENLNRRTKLWNEKNKVGYIYLFLFDKPVGYYAIKGKVSSVNSQITNPSQIITRYQSVTTMPSPAEDGSYGSNGDAVFFFLTDGTYVEWNGNYLLTDQMIPLDVPNFAKIKTTKKTKK